MKAVPILREQMDELLRFLPLFDIPGKQFVERWNGGRQQDGTIIMPSPVYLPEVEDFFRLAAHPPWCDRDYDPDSAGAMLDDDAAVSGADLDQIRSMLTYCERGERFCDGHWGAMLSSGRVVKLLRRLELLRDAGP